MEKEHPNVRLIRRAYEAFTGGGYPSVVEELFAEDAVWHLPGRGPLAGDHRGLDAVLAAMRRFEELSGGSIRVELHDVVGSGEHAAALLRASAAREGKRYEALEVDVYHIRDGKIAEFWSFAEDQRLTDEFWS